MTWINQDYWYQLWPPLRFRQYLISKLEALLGLRAMAHLNLQRQPATLEGSVTGQTQLQLVGTWNNGTARV